MPPTSQPSRQVLEELPSRSLKILSALSHSSILYAALAARGYTEPDHQEGWDLLLQVTGFRRPPVAAAESTAARDAAVELDAWDEPNFRLIRAALDRRHPDQSLFVFEGLSASTGAGAVLGVATLLDRLDALEKSPERKATRKADQAALDTLSKRGITTAERARLRALVATATTAAKAEEEASDAASDPAPNEALLKLHAWYGEWSEVARGDQAPRPPHPARPGQEKEDTQERTRYAGIGASAFEVNQSGVQILVCIGVFTIPVPVPGLHSFLRRLPNCGIKSA